MSSPQRLTVASETPISRAAAAFESAAIAALASRRRGVDALRERHKCNAEGLHVIEQRDHRSFEVSAEAI
jgi:hypothetical protein